MHSLPHAGQSDGAVRLGAITMAILLLTDRMKPGCVISRRSRLHTRLWAHLRACHLDQALASGVSPDSSAAISLRAQVLIRAAVRAGLAHSIRGLLQSAQRPSHPLNHSIPICRRKILASEASLEELAERLLARDPVDARGIAYIRLLLTDGSGPLYERPAADDLEAALHEAIEALDLTG